MTRAEEEAIQAQREATIADALEGLDMVANAIKLAVSTIRDTLPPEFRGGEERGVRTFSITDEEPDK